MAARERLERLEAREGREGDLPGAKDHPLIHVIYSLYSLYSTFLLRPTLTSYSLCLLFSTSPAHIDPHSSLNSLAKMPS
ncbi:uncharacterized protein H6S33_004552 [Morchella sextelata]|uniref:uncharacterized protein n=1 Tax=Morchella sextelata TaxID=1174677 RepID=UPI001D0397E6|nr:uncharacterized protein H6S33_004552 [Morchella sextelata]KAH0605330.1 hypothetical protein H6S33_004552 [Morchella sextelata]